VLGSLQQEPEVPLLRAGRLLRGPAIEGRSYEEMGCPRTVVNLRMCKDDVSATKGPWSEDVRKAIQFVHCGAENDMEKYDTSNPEVRKWLVSVLRIFEEPVRAPVLLHCRAGRDRTGVVAAVLALILGADEGIVVREFRLSVGASKKEALFQKCLEGIRCAGGIEAYFGEMLDLPLVRRHLTGIPDYNDEVEVAHLVAERRRLGTIARDAERMGEVEVMSHSLSWLLAVCQRGALLSRQDAEMMGIFGWALARLGRLPEAKVALEKGQQLAAAHGVRKAVQQMMAREIEALPEFSSSEIAAVPAGGLVAPGLPPLPALSVSRDAEQARKVEQPTDKEGRHPTAHFRRDGCTSSAARCGSAGRSPCASADI